MLSAIHFSKLSRSRERLKDCLGLLGKSRVGQRKCLEIKGFCYMVGEEGNGIIGSQWAIDDILNGCSNMH